MPVLRPAPTVGRAALSVVVLVAVLAGLLWAPFTPSPAAAAGSTAPTTRTSVVTAHSATYTDDKHTRTNYARQTTLRVSKARFAGYLAFPAPALQPGETITGARLVLTVTRANKVARKSGGIRVAPVATGWVAGGVTKKASPKTLAGTIAGPVRARPGRVTLSFSGAEATSYLAGGSAVRLRHSASRAEVRIAVRGPKAPVLEFTIAAAPATPGEVTPAPSPTSSSTAPVPDTQQFSIAVLPDTQKETMYASNTRFANRTKWLVDHRAKLNLKYVLHTGDVVNWGWLVPSQFTIAKAAVKKLADAGIPYSLTIGNHDTAAVGWNGKAGSTGYGGSAYAYNPECKVRLSTAECRSRLLVRKTAEFNQAFPVSTIKSVGGAFEAGKVDNIWTMFEAGGTKWLVLTLELWPRAAVVTWAQKVVAGHPGYNVVVQTHSYLTDSGGINQTNGGYGATSGQYLFDNLIRRYPNIKLVFSGHTGMAARRVDKGLNGNKIVSYLQTFHSGTTNPVRIVTINPASGLVTTRIIAPYTNETWSSYSTSDTISLVR
jgi:hypothetical protein